MEIINNNLKVSVPDALIVGAAKAGTTSLFNYLTDHPQIFTPRIKEPWYFSYRGKKPVFIFPTNGKINTKEIISDDLEYFDLFNEKDKYLIEGSTSYLYTAKETVKNIKEIYGESHKKLKIVIVLRNPVQRAWSHYMMHVRDNKTELSFLDSIKEEIISERINRGCIIGYDYIGFGMYYNQIKLFQENFPKVKIIIYDEFLQLPQENIDSLTDFFGINRFDFNTSKRYNVSGYPKNWVYKIIANFLSKENQFKSIIKAIFSKDLIYKASAFLKPILYKRAKISDKDKKILLKIYKEEILKVEKLIGYDLQHWLN